jgi:hypothetical protein
LFFSLFSLSEPVKDCLLLGTCFFIFAFHVNPPPSYRQKRKRLPNWQPEYAGQAVLRWGIRFSAWCPGQP